VVSLRRLPQRTGTLQGGRHSFGFELPVDWCQPKNPTTGSVTRAGHSVELEDLDGDTV